MPSLGAIMHCMESHDGLFQVDNIPTKEVVQGVCNSAECQGSSIANTGADRHEQAY